MDMIEVANSKISQKERLEIKRALEKHDSKISDFITDQLNKNGCGVDETSICECGAFTVFAYTFYQEKNFEINAVWDSKNKICFFIKCCETINIKNLNFAKQVVKKYNLYQQKGFFEIDYQDNILTFFYSFEYNRDADSEIYEDSFSRFIANAIDSCSGICDAIENNMSLDEVLL